MLRLDITFILEIMAVEDFIGAVLYLSSKASDFMTGAIMYVDGGYTAG